MNGTIGHLRNVADLVAALNIEAILAEARLASHESATDLALEVEAGVAALREVAALVEESNAALALVSDRFGALMLSAVRAERFDLADVLFNIDDNKASDADLALLRKALAEKTITAEYDADLVEEAPAEEEEDDAPSFTRCQVSALRDEAAKAGDIETVDACETWLLDSTDEDAADIIDEALSYAAAQ